MDKIAPYADLQAANLYEADLRAANLRGASLRGASLRGANLRGANLYGANLYGANLREASLRGADLYGADLRGANLYGADLRGANLYGADLYGADLREASLPPPAMLWLVGWGTLSASLTLEAMRWDAYFHPDKTAFAAWKRDDRCPYTGLRWERAVNFQENRSIWKAGQPKMSPMEFTLALFAEKKIKR